MLQNAAVLIIMYVVDFLKRNVLGSEPNKSLREIRERLCVCSEKNRNVKRLNHVQVHILLQSVYQLLSPIKTF